MNRQVMLEGPVARADFPTPLRGHVAASAGARATQHLQRGDA